MTRSLSARRLASAACLRRWEFLGAGGAIWMSGALHGKVGGAFTSTATQHGGNETTLFSIIANLMHFGLVIVGLPYSHAGQMHARRNRRRRALRRNHDRGRAGPAPADARSSSKAPGIRAS